MVWTLVIPSMFGAYSPDGDFVGWRERLTAYYRHEMTPEERSKTDIPAYIYDVVKKFILERFSPRNYRNLTPLMPHEVPETFKTKKTVTKLDSLVKLTDRLLAVDETLKGIIEQLEPGVHEFYPIKIIMPKNQPFPKNYFLIVIGQYLESFSPAKSVSGSWEESEDVPGRYSCSGTTEEEISGLAFERAVIGKAHLWGERNMRSGDAFLSDTLQSEITKAGLKISKFIRVMEV